MTSRKVYTGMLAKPTQEESEFELVGRMREAMKELQSVKSTDIMLDLGCKGSWLEQSLHHKIKQIVAVDLDPDFIKHNQIQNKYQNVKYQVMDATAKYPFSNNHFDIVTLLEVIEHVPTNTEPQVLAEIYRVLKPGGKLILTTPASHWLSNLFDVAHWLIGHRHYRAEWLAAVLSQAGFERVQVRVKGRFFDALAVLSYYVFKPFHLDGLVKNTMIRLTQRDYDRGTGFNHLIAVAYKK